jgi:3-phenylpropionate/trans-cinnamate dioxygenase ferredoxin reductase component
LTRRVVVVGASAAGLATAEALRSRGYDGALTLIGEEQRLPYDRPPLSKQILDGSWEPDRVMLRDEQGLRKIGADLLLGHTAVGLDTTSRRVLLDHGDSVGYDDLVIATGVAPRRLPDADLAGIHLLRTLDDALTLRAQLLARPKVAVVGAGFLGAEVAAVARQMGLEVAIVDPQPPMSRQFGEQVGVLIAQLHSDNGVTLRIGVGVSRFVAADGRVVGIELADESVIDADLVIVAVGAAPVTGWLADSALTLANGVECDAFCEAAPGIYAAGDVASWYNPHFGVRMRVEHRTNATEQAIAVAGNLLGDARPFAPIPYCWTDQYDAKIQAHGIFPSGAETLVLSGNLSERQFVVGYCHNDRMVGVLGWNMPRGVRELRRLVVERAPWKATTVRNPIFDGRNTATRPGRVRT